MTSPLDHPALRTFIAEHTSPTHCGTTSVHAQIGPLEDVVAKARLQLAHERSLLRQVEMATDATPAIRAKVTLLRNRIKVAGQAVEAMSEATERWTAAMVQLDGSVQECATLLEPPSVGGARV
jgi:hypothetical protein